MIAPPRWLLVPLAAVVAAPLACTEGLRCACSPKIVGLEAEASGRLTLRFEPGSEFTACTLLATRIARVIAVPRRVLPASVVFLNGFAFEVPEVPFE
jgi:hypothetical protein